MERTHTHTLTHTISNDRESRHGGGKDAKAPGGSGPTPREAGRESELQGRPALWGCPSVVWLSVGSQDPC